MTKPIAEILYCHVLRSNQKLESGHWFFHTGQWALCASAERNSDRYWRATVYWAPLGKDVPENIPPMRTISEVIAFTENFFGRPVRKVQTKGFPALNQL